MPKLRDWTFPESETGERGLRGVLFIALFLALVVGVPLLVGTEVIL